MQQSTTTRNEEQRQRRRRVDLEAVFRRFPDENVLLTTEEAAAFLRCAIPTLERWRKEGTGPKHVKVARKPLYLLTELRRFAGVEAA